MIIDSITSFMQLTLEDVAKVELLFLPNHSADTLTDEFFTRLQRANSLCEINLRNNNLCEAALLRVAQTLKQRDATAIPVQPLRTINLYHCAGTTQAVLDAFHELGADTIPARIDAGLVPFAFAQDWINPAALCESELHEIFKVAKFKKAQNPQLLKLHSYQNHTSRKGNRALSAPTDEQTNLPMPVVFAGTRPFIVPKYDPWQIPEKLRRLATRMSSLPIHKRKRIKLTLTQDAQRITPGWVKIYKSRPQTTMFDQAIAVCRSTGQSYDYVSRSYAIPQFAGVHKEYFFTEYAGPHDGFDFINKLVDQGMAFGSKDPAKATDNETYLTFVIAMLLEVICVHNNGILHLDVKLENFMVHNAAEVQLIDCDYSARVLPGQPAAHSTFFGTPAYRAPEAQYARLGITQPTPALDYYACGIAMCYSLITQPALSVERTLELMREHNAQLAQIVSGMLQTDPQQRMSIQRAFVALHALFPALFAPPLQAKRQRLVNDIQQKCAAYPQIQAMLTPIMQGLPTSDDLKTSLNSIFRLQTIKHYLCAFEFGKNLPHAEALFDHAVELMQTQPDKEILDCTGMYFYDAGMEEFISNAGEVAPAADGSPAKRARMEA